MPDASQIINLTPQGCQQLKTDKQKLETKREQVLIRLQTAREMGDLSENAAYHSAKFELGNIDRQLIRLKDLIQFGKPTTPTDNHTIQFGHTVTLKTDSGKIDYTLVSSHESDPEQNKLSVNSPLGQQLIGKKNKDRVTLKTPDSTTTYTIEKISTAT